MTAHAGALSDMCPGDALPDATAVCGCGRASCPESVADGHVCRGEVADDECPVHGRSGATCGGDCDLDELSPGAGA